MKIKNLRDLLTYFEADDILNLNHRVYKDTYCGASISLQTPDGKWHHNGSGESWGREWSKIKRIKAFTIQTIVEGSDAEVKSPPFTLPVESDEIDKFIRYMEGEAELLWKEANEDGDEEN